MSGIVLTTDLSETSRRAFAPCIALAAGLGLPITLLAVVEDLPFEPSGGGLMASYPDRAQIVADWETQLGKIAAELAVPGLRTVVVDAMDVARAVVDFAAKEHADYIALASHGRSGLRRLLLGSVAEAVLRHSHVPVIVFPPPPEST